MSPFFLVLCSSLTLNHAFYENYGQTQLVADLVKARAWGNLYLLASASHQNDLLIDRSSTFYQGLIRQSFGFARDTGAFGLYGLQKLQKGSSYSSRETGVGALVFLAAKPTKSLRLSGLSDIGLKSYYSQDSATGNSGLQQDLYIDLNTGKLAASTHIIAEARQMQSQQSVYLNPKLQTSLASAELELSTGHKRYSTVAGQEDRVFNQALGELSLINSRFISLKPTAFYSRNLYQLNQLNSNASGGLGFEMTTTLELVGTKWDIGLSRDMGFRDFLNYQGDEENQSARLEISGTKGFAGQHTVELVSRVEKQWFDYPQGLVPDDRDDRVIFTMLRTGIKAWQGGKVEFGLLNRTQDLVFLRTARSGETRRQSKYSCYAKLVYSGPVSLDFRNEVSAIYTTYRFNPLNNLLVRYWENALFLKASSFHTLVRLRLGDNGNYMARIYYPGVFYRELWFQPSVLLLRTQASSIHLLASQYTRFQKTEAGWNTSTQELGIGFDLKLNLGLETRIMLMRRTDTGYFWDLGLSYNPM